MVFFVNSILNAEYFQSVKTTCNIYNIQINKHYAVFGSAKTHEVF